MRAAKAGQEFIRQRGKVALSSGYMNGAGEKPYPFLPRAPIVEAILEIRATFEDGWEAMAVKAAMTAAFPDFPSASLLESIALKAKFSSENPDFIGPFSKENAGTEVELVSTDRKRKVVFGKEVFRYSCLAPYPGWNEFAGEAVKLWQGLHKTVKLKGIQRVGVRFINQMNLPIAEWLSYLKNFYIPIRSPHEWGLKGFFSQSTFIVPAVGLNVNILASNGQPAKTSTGPTELPIILDIDVFTDKPDITTDGGLGALLGKVRETKNQAFFNLITHKAVEKYQ